MHHDSTIPSQSESENTLPALSEKITVELSLPISDAQLYGTSDEHILWLDKTTGIHRDMATDWALLQSAAKAEGFDLAIASGFRSFARQQIIWERKLAGQAPVLDDKGNALDINSFDEEAQSQLIMRWSALPGASRHHWGTDLDIFDKAAMPQGYQLQLTASEYTGNGLFAPLRHWLQDFLQQSPSPQFFFPYNKDKGGVGVEPWHLSYRPIAAQYQQRWRKKDCCAALRTWQHSHAGVLINSIDALYDRFIEPTLMINDDN